MLTTLSPHCKMDSENVGPDIDELMKVLFDNFNILADDVQLLSDRKTVLEHKLRFAYAQYQCLADTYAPSSPEISSILAKLQLPSDLNLQSSDQSASVPLPARISSVYKQRTAEAIRDGRRASKRLASLRGWTTVSEAGGKSTSGTSYSVQRISQLGTSATTPLEQDFTVPGKRSQLLCPLVEMVNRQVSAGTTNPRPSPEAVSDLISNHPDTTSEAKLTSYDPISDQLCAASYAETHSSPPLSVTGSAAKCPIRFLDEHPPEEVAKYFETHKHEIPRSHEVCVKRYQRNEEDIRKLDAKYGNIVSMIKGLGQKHRPMLPMNEQEQTDRDDRRSHERVESWANGVSANDFGELEAHNSRARDGEDRAGRFDRPMKEVRVGESPSRPWGISVPYVGPPDGNGAVVEIPIESAIPANITVSAQDPENKGKCPFGHGQKSTGAKISLSQIRHLASDADPRDQNDKKNQFSHPSFIQSPELNKTSGNGGPQMVFTGPVFIGYPVEQAMALLHQWQSGMNTE